MTSKEIKDWYQKLFDQVDLKKILLDVFVNDNDFIEIISTKKLDEPIKVVPITSETKKFPNYSPPKLKGWIQYTKLDGTVVLEKKISHCKRCNIQNEYIDFNPNYICYSCKS